METHAGVGVNVSYADTPAKNTKRAVLADLALIDSKIAAVHAARISRLGDPRLGGLARSSLEQFWWGWIAFCGSERAIVGVVLGAHQRRARLLVLISTSEVTRS